MSAFFAVSVLLYASLLKKIKKNAVPQFADRFKKVRKYPSERLSAQPRYPENTGQAKWRRSHSTWDLDYFGDVASFWNSIVRRMEFRRKFRIPRVLFDRIFGDMKGSGSFRDTSDRHICGARPHPLNLKFASCLRIVGLGAGMDVAEEGSGISEGTVSKFVPQWLEWFVQHNFAKWVKGIDSDEELRKVEGDFAKLVFPGCVSHTDAMHAHYPACPSAKVGAGAGADAPGAGVGGAGSSPTCGRCAASSSTLWLIRRKISGDDKSTADMLKFYSAKFT
jgi:hypothetical protein